MSVGFFVVLAALMEGFLIYMAREDVQNHCTVPVLPGYIALGACASLYLAGCLFTWTVPEGKKIIIGLVFIGILHLLKVFGRGDAKALAGILFLSAYSLQKKAPVFHGLDYALPMLTYSYAVMLSVPINLVKSIKGKQKMKEILFGTKRRFAFFPYLAIGFGISVFSYLFSYYCFL